MNHTLPDLSLYPPFSNWPEDRRRALSGLLDPRSLEDNEVLFEALEPARFACFVTGGMLALTNPDGTQYTAPEGSYLGQAWLAPGKLTPFRAAAVGACQVWLLHLDDWLAFQATLPPWAVPPDSVQPHKNGPNKLAPPAGRQPQGKPRPWHMGQPRRTSAPGSARPASAGLSAGFYLSAAVGLLALCAWLLGGLAWASAHRLVVSGLIWVSRPDLAQRYLVGVQRIDRRADLYEMLGRVQMGSGDAESAVDQFARAIALDDQDALAWNNLGVAELALSDSPERIQSAAAHFKRAAELDPTRAEVFVNLGSAQYAAGLLDLAAAATLQATQLDPQNLAASTQYAAILAVKGQAEQAQRVWLNVLAAPGASAAIQNLAGEGVGMLLLQAGRPEEAAAYLEAAALANLHRCQTRLYLGAAYEAAHHLERAEEAYRQALQLCPTSSISGDTRARLLSLIPRLEGR